MVISAVFMLRLHCKWAILLQNYCYSKTHKRIKCRRQVPQCTDKITAGAVPAMQVSAALATLSRFYAQPYCFHCYFISFLRCQLGEEFFWVCSSARKILEFLFLFCVILSSNYNNLCKWVWCCLINLHPWEFMFTVPTCTTVLILFLYWELL